MQNISWKGTNELGNARDDVSGAPSFGLTGSIPISCGFFSAGLKFGLLLALGMMLWEMQVAREVEIGSRRLGGISLCENERKERGVACQHQIIP